MRTAPHTRQLYSARQHLEQKEKLQHGQMYPHLHQQHRCRRCGMSSAYLEAIALALQHSMQRRLELLERPQRLM